MTDTSKEAVAERRAQIIALTEQGWTAAAIADRLGITKRSVARGRAAAGIAQPRAPLMTDDEKRAARTMLDDGASYHEVGRTIGRSASTIERNLPGYTWDQRRCSEAAALGRAMARLNRQTPLAIATGNRAHNPEGKQPQ